MVEGSNIHLRQATVETGKLRNLPLPTIRSQLLMRVLFWFRVNWRVIWEFSFVFWGNFSRHSDSNQGQKTLLPLLHQDGALVRSATEEQINCEAHLWLIKLGYRGYSYVKVFEAILEAGEAAEAIKEERKTKKWNCLPQPGFELEASGSDIPESNALPTELTGLS